jgi:HSP20 family protein
MFTPGGMLDNLRLMEREMNAFMDAVSGRPSLRAWVQGSFPAINIGTTPEAVQIYIFAPGIDPAAVDLSIQGNVMSVSGERKTPTEGEKGGYHLQERFNGSFRRVFSLPEDVDPEQVNAVYKDGVLTVTVGKRHEARPRSIQVKAA